MKSQKLKDELLKEIQLYLPKEESTYVDIGCIPFCSAIKYIDPDGGISYFTGSIRIGELHPDHIDRLPVEALETVLEALKKRE